MSKHKSYIFRSGLPSSDGWYWIRRKPGDMARLFRRRDGKYREFGKIVETGLENTATVEYCPGNSPDVDDVDFSMFGP